MRNIPDQEEYFALLIEFDFEDFNDLPQNAGTSQNYVQGQLNPGEFKHEVRQFQKPYDNQQAEQISLMV